KRRFPWWLVGVLYVAALVLGIVGHRSYGFARYALPQAPLHHDAPVELRVTRDARLLAHAEPLLAPWVQNTYYAAMPPAEREKPPVLELGVEPAADTAPGEMLCLMGDSHASHLVDGLAHHLRRRGRRGVFLASIMVPFHGWDFRPNRMPSYQFNPPKEEALYRWLAAHPEITRLVIGCRWAHQIEAMHLTTAAAEADLRAFLRRVRALGKQVVLVAPVQEFGVSLTLMPRALALRGIGATDARFTRLTSCSQAKYRADHAEVLEMLRRMEAEGLCSVLCVLDGLAPGECIPAVEGNTALYGDTNHYTPAGSIWFINKVGSRLEP
ncbi:MAG: hypothetical protein J1E42_06315, partial [Akkermansiaceae bacterium]|nr:hypothetical protein [Akkermansiaceae bacterium]